MYCTYMYTYAMYIHTVIKYWMDTDGAVCLKGMCSSLLVHVFALN